MSQVQISDREKGYIQVLECCRISFNTIKLFADAAAANDSNKHIVVNMQYTMKYLYEQMQRTELQLNQMRIVNAPGTPLNSSIKGMRGLTAEEAIMALRTQTIKQNK
jgi:hypothetical protein